MSPTDILHKLIDVAAGRSNLPPHEADVLHEELTPGFTAQPMSDADKDQLAALLKRANAEADAAKAAAPEDVAV